MKRVLVPLAAGFEEIEAMTIIDVLRRAGVEVVVAGAGPAGQPIEGSWGVRVTPDRSLDDARASDFDMVVLPGGTKGVENLKRHPKLLPLLGEFMARGKHVAAICAAPLLLAEAGLLCGKQVTSYPSVKPQVAASSLYSEERVVQDGKLVTSRGPGTAMEFAFVLVGILAGEEKARELKQGMLAR